VNLTYIRCDFDLKQPFLRQMCRFATNLPFSPTCDKSAALRQICRFASNLPFSPTCDKTAALRQICRFASNLPQNNETRKGFIAEICKKILHSLYQIV